MKLDKRLTVGATEVQLASDEVILEMSAGGRAMFTFAGTAKPGQLVALDIGYNLDFRRWFVGIIERVQPAQNGYVKAFCRELAGLLAQRFTVSIQHATLRQVITELASQSGLAFLLPSADYVDTPIPNFASHGSGYQLLQNAGRAFSVPDWIWYQQTDGQIWVGGYADSFWADKATTLSDTITSRQAGGDSMSLLAIPACRPGVTINGKRITQVRLAGSEMTIKWAATSQTIEQRRMAQQFPELAAGFHLPKFGRVVAVADSAQAGQLADRYRPRYAVDVQLLTEDGADDTSVPVYQAVPLPVLFGGPEQGMMQFPIEGTLVEIGFAFGRADQPFIRSVLGQDWPLPTIAPGEQLQQQRAEVYQRTDAAGNQTRATDRQQSDQAHQMHRQADEYLGQFGQHRLEIDQHSIETLGGSKIIEALGNIELLAAGGLDLTSLGSQRHTTGGDLTQLVGQIRRDIAGELQHMEAPLTWLGTDSTNIIRLLLQLMELVQQLAATCASHNHGNSAPTNAATFNNHASTAGDLASTLAPITE